jgi:hypothetical protein
MVELQLNLQTLQYLRRRFAFWARAARCSSRNFRASSVLADDFLMLFVGRGGVGGGGLVGCFCGLAVRGGGLGGVRRGIL